MVKLFKNFLAHFSPPSKIFYIPSKEVWIKLLFCLIVGIKLVLLTLIFPIIAIVVGIVLMTFGKISLLEFWDNTCKLFIDYYYSGTLFNITAWRYHLLIFGVGLICEFLNDD